MSKPSDRCTHCLFLNQQLGALLRTDHPSHKWGKRSVSVNLVESLDVDSPDYAKVLSNSDEGDTIIFSNSLCDVLQSHEHLGQTHSETVEDISPSASLLVKNINDQPPEDLISPVSDAQIVQCPIQSNLSIQPSTKCDEKASIFNIEGNENTNCPHQLTFDVAVLKLSSSSFHWSKIVKKNSPKLKCILNKLTFPGLVDSGAEVNVLDKKFAQTINLDIVPSKVSAQAADKIPLDIIG